MVWGGIFKGPEKNFPPPQYPGSLYTHLRYGWPSQSCLWQKWHDSDISGVISFYCLNAFKVLYAFLFSFLLQSLPLARVIASIRWLHTFVSSKL